MCPHRAIANLLHPAGVDVVYLITCCKERKQVCTHLDPMTLYNLKHVFDMADKLIWPLLPHPLFCFSAVLHFGAGSAPLIHWFSKLWEALPP